MFGLRRTKRRDGPESAAGVAPGVASGIASGGGPGVALAGLGASQTDALLRRLEWTVVRRLDGREIRLA